MFGLPLNRRQQSSIDFSKYILHATENCHSATYTRVAHPATVISCVLHQLSATRFDMCDMVCRNEYRLVQIKYVIYRILIYIMCKILIFRPNTKCKQCQANCKHKNKQNSRAKTIFFGRFLVTAQVSVHAGTVPIFVWF